MGVVLRKARNTGGNVVFSFGNGYTLRVVDITENQLRNNILALKRLTRAAQQRAARNQSNLANEVFGFT